MVFLPPNHDSTTCRSLQVFPALEVPWTHVKEKTKYDYDLSNDNAFINTPKMGDIVEKDQPLLSIYLNANNSGLLLRKLKQKISITTNLFSCYDIDI